MRDWAAEISKLLAFAREHALNLDTHYAECDDTLSVDVWSAAPAEEYGEKRLSTADSFIASWHEHLRKGEP